MAIDITAPRTIKKIPLYKGSQFGKIIIRIPIIKPAKLIGLGISIPDARLKQIKIIPLGSESDFGRTNIQIPIIRVIMHMIPIANEIKFFFFITLPPDY